MTRRRWLGAAVIGLFFASGLLAKQGTLTTKDGRRFDGDIENASDGQFVNVTVDGATISVASNDVASILYPRDAAEEFQQRLASLDPNDIKGRIDLSRWELEQRHYDLAAEAATDIQRIDPHDPDAAILLDTIASQRALDAHLSHQPAAAPSSPQTGGAAVSSGAPAGNYLTMDDVQAIRRHELTADDHVRINFTDDVRKHYLALTGTDADAFNSETPAQQALDIFQSGGPKLARDVEIGTEPSVMLEFRASIEPRILAGCAAAGCHGSAASGGFFLYPDRGNTLVAYTNFYILQQTTRKLSGGDSFGNAPVARPMFDPLHRGSSLLLQFGLPRSVAELPHPSVPGFEPIFHSQHDPRYMEVSDWIGSLNPIVSNEAIHYQIPTSQPAE